MDAIFETTALLAAVPRFPLSMQHPPGRRRPTPSGQVRRSLGVALVGVLAGSGCVRYVDTDRTCEVQVFWAEGGSVRSATRDFGAIETLVSGGPENRPTAVAVDGEARRIYWADNGTDTIYTARHDGSSIQPLYHSSDPFSNPDGLAIDETRDELFWVEGGVVRRSRLDGTDGDILIPGTPPGNFPTSVAVDSRAKMYWADNATDTIHVADYDGSSAHLIHASTDSYSNPRGLSIDGDRDRVFWAEGGAVRNSRLDGTDGGIVIPGVPSSNCPTSVAVDPYHAKIYWADNMTDSIHVANYDGSSAQLLYVSADPLSNPRGLAVACVASSPGTGGTGDGATLPTFPPD
jgi:DNA-binding beta-propeller fold protein YncE